MLSQAVDTGARGDRRPARASCPRSQGVGGPGRGHAVTRQQVCFPQRPHRLSCRQRLVPRFLAFQAATATAGAAPAAVGRSKRRRVLDKPILRAGSSGAQARQSLGTTSLTPSTHHLLAGGAHLSRPSSYLDRRRTILRKSWSARSSTWSLVASMQPSSAPQNRAATPMVAHTADLLASLARSAREAADAALHTHALLSVKG